MICTICHEDKLSNEFPPVPATEECNHFYCICLRCSVKSMKNGKCPDEKCRAEVDSNRLKLFQKILRKQFPDLNEMETITATGECQKETDVHSIILTILNGESVNISYKSSMNIKDLKALIHKELGIESTKQRIFYKQQELLVYKNEKYEEYTVDDYDIRPAATIYLIHIRFTISPRIEDVVYELEWGYPVSQHFLVRNLPGFIKNWYEQDFVDGTCIVCKKSEIVGKVHSKSLDKFPGIKQGKSEMTNSSRKGFQKMEVKMNEIDREITSLFFILSARSAPSIHAYPNKRFILFQTKGDDPEKPLCDFAFDKEKKYDRDDRALAIIVCSVTKNKDDMGAHGVR